LIEVGAVTIICCFCFFVRTFFLILTAFDIALDTNTYVMLMYYFMVEILPCISVLVILSRLPPGPLQSIESNYTDVGRESRGKVNEDEERSRSLILSSQNAEGVFTNGPPTYGTVNLNSQ